MGKRELEHLNVPFNPDKEPFRNPKGGGSSVSRSPKDRKSHALFLINELKNVYSEDYTEDKGAYLAIRLFPELDSILEKLDSKNIGDKYLSLCNVRQIDKNEQMAVVFVPHGAKGRLFKKLDEYNGSLDKKNPKHRELIDSIQDIRRATVRDLWTDPLDLYPESSSEKIWWEVWLRKSDGFELKRFKDFSSRLGMELGRSFLAFGGRIVFLVKASVDQLAQATKEIDDLAELRKPRVVPTEYLDLTPIDQKEWVDGLVQRIKPPNLDAPAVCVLDTGVYEHHPLLAPAISESDIFVADPNWVPLAKEPHGTEMAGLALCGNVQEVLESQLPIDLNHRLESVKILPDNQVNSSELYGQLTAYAVYYPEIESAYRNRLFMLAITEQSPNYLKDKGEIGQPTSWSAAIDALAFGQVVENEMSGLTALHEDPRAKSRLFIISGGNIPTTEMFNDDDHLVRCDLNAIESPAQAWNALTVGAYSAQDTMDNAPKAFDGYTPIAQRGELSPVSRTSVLWDDARWPFKPEVVADGGNLAQSPDKAYVDTPPNLALLTTRLNRSGGAYLTTTRDTSAATAQVAAIAAAIMAAYPTMSAEMVRALVVHSAEWTDAMKTHFEHAKGKRAYRALMRRYGMGVPDRTRAIKSAANALNLLVEGNIQPYVKAGQNKIGQMHLHELPWPEEELLEMTCETVRMRVTLSYFIDPNPSRRGWKGRYRYASYGLRFASNAPEETRDKFRARINKLAREESGEDTPSLDTSTSTNLDPNWLFGADNRSKPGSLHTDIWEGSPAELATKRFIAVYPVGGWWKDHKFKNQILMNVNYSLVVSIEAPGVEVDLWTPIKAQIEAQTQVPVQTEI